MSVKKKKFFFTCAHLRHWCCFISGKMVSTFSFKLCLHSCFSVCLGGVKDRVAVCVDGTTCLCNWWICISSSFWHGPWPCAFLIVFYVRVWLWNGEWNMKAAWQLLCCSLAKWANEGRHRVIDRTACLKHINCCWEAGHGHRIQMEIVKPGRLVMSHTVGTNWSFCMFVFCSFLLLASLRWSKYMVWLVCWSPRQTRFPQSQLSATQYYSCFAQDFFFSPDWARSIFQAYAISPVLYVCGFFFFFPL